MHLPPPANLRQASLRLTPRSRLIETVAQWAACGLLLVGLGIILVMLSKWPLYTDEVQWKALSARVFLDNLKLNYLFPACPAGRVLPMPLTWWPSRVLDAVLYADASSPARVRYFGIATFLTLMAGTAWIAKNAMPAVHLVAIVVGLLAATSFGVLIPLLVLNRPEQGILTAAIPMLAIFSLVMGKKWQPTPAASWILCVAFVVCTWLMLGAHIKSFVLLPAVVFAAFVAIRRTAPFTIFALLASLCFAETYLLWQARTDCPEVAHLTQVFSNLSVSPKMALANPLGFANRLLLNLIDASSYVRSGFISTEYQSSWLPSSTDIPLPSTFSNAALAASIIVAVFYSGGRAVASLRREIQQSTIMCALLLLAAIGLTSYQITKNFYELSLLAPLIILAVIFSLSGSRMKSIRIDPRWGSAVLGLFGCICQSALIMHLLPMTAAWDSRASELSVSLPELHALGQSCGIGATHDQRGLVVDDEAYSAYWPTSDPIFSPYFYGWWATGVDYREVVDNLKLDGMIAHCSAMPEEYRASSSLSSSGRFCCHQF